MGATIKIPSIFTANDQFSSVIMKMTKGVTRFSKVGVSAVQRFDSRVTKTFRKMNNLTQLALGLGVGALFLSAFEDVKSFETGLVGVSKTTGIVDADLKKLGKDFVITSKSLRGVSSIELTQLGQSAGQLGVTGSQNILKFSETMAKLGKATDAGGEEGASSIARLLTITGEGVGVIDQFGSSLVALGNNSAATEKEILSVASEVSRSTAAYKLTSAQILGISTALKSLDVKPEAAGSAVIDVFKGIEMATIKGGSILRGYGKVMGLTEAQVKETFQKSPEQAFNIFIKGLNRISNNGGSVTKALDSLGLSSKTVTKGIIPLATNYDLLNEKMALSQKGFEENIALNNEFDAATKTVNTALADIKKSWSNVFIAQANAGSGLEKLQNILFFVSDNMENIVLIGSSLIGMFGLMKAIIWGTKVATFAYNVALGINTALTQSNKRAIIGNTIATNAYKVAMAITTAVTWLANSAFVTLAISILAATWPILAVIAAVVAIIAIFYYWDEIVAWFSKQWERFTSWISDLWGNVVSWFKEFDFKSFFMEIGQSILKFMLMPMTALLTLLSKIPGKIGDMASLGLEKIGNLTGEMNVDDNRKTLPSPESRNAEITRETIGRGKIDVNFNDKNGNVKDVETSGDFDFTPQIGNTQGAF